jgi:hypothetical protein
MDPKDQEPPANAPVPWSTLIDLLVLQFLYRWLLSVLHGRGLSDVWAALLSAAFVSCVAAIWIPLRFRIFRRRG